MGLCNTSGSPPVFVSKLMGRGSLIGVIAGIGALAAGLAFGLPVLALAGGACAFGFLAFGWARGVEKRHKEKTAGLDSRGRAQLARLERAQEKLKSAAEQESLSSPIAEAAYADSELIIMEARRLLEQRSHVSELARRRSLIEHEITSLERQLDGSKSLVATKIRQKQEQLEKVVSAERTLEQIDEEVSRAESEMMHLYDTLQTSTVQSVEVATDDLSSLVDRLKSLSQVVEEAETMLEQRI